MWCFTTPKLDHTQVWSIVKNGLVLLPHPLYCPDLVPSDFHLFRFLQNSLNGETFASEDLKQRLDKFLTEKNRMFHERGIMEFPERWPIYYRLMFITYII